MPKIMYYTGDHEVWKCDVRYRNFEDEQETEDYLQALYRYGYHLRDHTGNRCKIEAVVHPSNRVGQGGI